MLGEVVAGVLAHSLALLADAGHMLTDAAALGMAVGAATMAERPPRGRWTWGFRRLEVMAAQVNGATLALIGIWIVYSAVVRLVSPPDVHGQVVLAVALAGIVVNVAATASSRARTASRSTSRAPSPTSPPTSPPSSAPRSPARVVLLTGWNRADPVASLAIAGLMFWAAGGLLRESGRIFLEVSPRDLDPDEVGRAIAEVDEVAEAHDLHVWTVTSGFPALSAHVLCRADADCHAVRRRIERMLRERFDLEHTTLQVDHAAPRGAAPVEFQRHVHRG